MLNIESLDELRQNWGRSPQLLRSAGWQHWNAHDCQIFLRRVCGTISEQWLRVLFDGRYVFHKDLLKDSPLSLRDGTRIVSAAKLEDYLMKGATVVVRGAHSYHENAFLFYEQLAERFGCHVSCNLYTANSNGVGFRQHFDTHHILVLQVQGSKTWLVSPQPERRSSKVISVAEQLTPPKSARLSFDLVAGDALYLPRGCWHKAKPGAEGSTHFSFGLHIPTRGEIYLEEARRAAEKPEQLEDFYGFDGSSQSSIA